MRRRRPGPPTPRGRVGSDCGWRSRLPAGSREGQKPRLAPGAGLVPGRLRGRLDAEPSARLLTCGGACRSSPRSASVASGAFPCAWPAGQGSVLPAGCARGASRLPPRSLAAGAKRPDQTPSPPPVCPGPPAARRGPDRPGPNVHLPPRLLEETFPLNSVSLDG